MAEKRPADSEPSEETLAVCTSCSNVSNSLETCEHCGSDLSADSASRCYSSAPKRSRLDSPEQNSSSQEESQDKSDNSLVNGHLDQGSEGGSASGEQSSASEQSTGSSVTNSAHISDKLASTDNRKSSVDSSASSEHLAEKASTEKSTARPPSPIHPPSSPELGATSSSSTPKPSSRPNTPADRARTHSRSNSPATSTRTNSPSARSKSNSRNNSPNPESRVQSAAATTKQSSTANNTTPTPIMNGNPVVPQMLYVNNNIRGSAPPSNPPAPNPTSGTAPAPTPVGGPTPVGPPIPAGLFVNVNNHAVPIPTQASAGTGSGEPMDASSNSSSVSNTNTTPTNVASRTRSSTGVSPAAVPTANRNPPPYPAPPANQPTSNANKFSLVIDVDQIRVGVRKFLPMPNSSVLFKDDGVLFTLKEYPNAPLLLNARAIQQCKANLSNHMPALFFYLEASCIKQIRNIFKMNQQEFTEKSTVDRVSTIALFPTMMDETRAAGIKTSFEIMQQKFNRPQSILKEVSSDVIIDFMYGFPPVTDGSIVNNAAVSRSNPQMNTGPPPLQSIQSSRPAVPNMITQPTPAAQMLRNVAQSSMMIPGVNTQQQLPNQMHPMMAQSLTRAANPMQQPAPVMSQRTMNQAPPLLTIPEDHEQWNNVKRKLVPGGVYQVQTRDGQRKYCLWNGTTLVPCLVQDTEVQLKCENVRIGSLRCKAVDTVRIRNDGANSGIHFKFISPYTRAAEEIFISQDELVDCLVCFDRVQAMFVYPTAQCATKIRTKCKMPGMAKDPTYNPFSKEERRRHLILFLKNINTEQRESLMQLKRAGAAEHQRRDMVRIIDQMNALQIMSSIKSNMVMVQPKINEYMNNRQDLESLAREIQNPDGNDGVPPAAEDDDDDDVIMTQEEIGVKCPYTQQIMKEPIKNRVCGHNYEKAAILEFIARRKAKGNARCPYAGCGNQRPLVVEDLVENTELKQYIQKKLADGSLSTS